MTQSHGQSLMSHFRSRYRIKGIYFADEPRDGVPPPHTGLAKGWVDLGVLRDPTVPHPPSPELRRAHHRGLYSAAPTGADAG